MAGEYKVSAAVQQVYTQLMAATAVRTGTEFLAADHQQTIADQIAINQVPAPPFQETQRARYYLQRLQETGFVGAFAAARLANARVMVVIAGKCTRWK